METEKAIRLRSEFVLSATINGRVKALEGIALKAKMMQVLVRFVKPMEAITGMDNTRYGPFQEEDVAVIPFENAKTLMEKGIVVELPWFDQ
jgi:DNA replication factor GINS